MKQAATDRRHRPGDREAAAGPWRRVLWAVALGGGSMVAGAVLGAAVGAVSMVACGGVAVVVFFLGVSGWAVHRVGAAGVAVGFLGCIACVGSGIDVPRWWRLEHLPLKELSSVLLWPAEDTSAALHVPGIREDVTLRSTARWSSRIGKSNSPQAQTATPLVEGPAGEIVGFVCSDGARVPPPAGEWLLPLAVWGGDSPPDCERPIALAAAQIAAARRPMDASAQQRVYLAFASEAALRGATDPTRTARTLVGLFVLYVFSVVVFRRRVLTLD